MIVVFTINMRILIKRKMNILDRKLL